jgi:hypothetical protein
MSASEFDQLAAEFGRNVVARAAPQELPLYRAISESYIKDPQHTIKYGRNKDEMLGFGMAETVTYLTPIILPVLSTVFKFIAEEIKSSIHDQHLVGDTLKKLLTKAGIDKGGNGAAQLTSEQLSRVRQLAFDKAVELKLQDKQASLLADSIVGSLALAASR